MGIEGGVIWNLELGIEDWERVLEGFRGDFFFAQFS